MIQARGLLERHLQGRRSAAIIATLVVLLVLLVGIHPISDDVVDHAAVVCAAAVLVLGSLILVGQEPTPAARTLVGRPYDAPHISSGPPAVVQVDDRSSPLLR